MTNKRLTGEDFDQKLFRSLARIGSSIRLPSRGSGINLPNVGNKPNRPNKPGRGRSSRINWPSDSEIADMVDRNGNGFVGDGEPWMQRVRRTARQAVSGKRPKGQSGGLLRDLAKIRASANEQESGGLNDFFSSTVARLREKYPRADRLKATTEQANLVKSIVKVADKENVEDALTVDNVLSIMRFQLETGSNSDPIIMQVLDDESALRSLAQQVGYLDKMKKDYGISLDELKADTSPDSEEIIHDLVGSTLRESEIFSSVVERFGWPKTTLLYKTLPTQISDDHPDATPEELNIVVGGFHNGLFSVMGLSSDLVRWWIGDKSMSDEVSDDRLISSIEKPDSPGGPNISNNITGIIRHEYGHHADMYTKMRGTPEQRDAVARIEKWFEDSIPMINDLFDQTFEGIAIRMEEEGLTHQDFESDDLAIFGKISEIKEEFADLLDLIDEFSWISTYAKTSPQEFLAELFAMATSPDPAVRNAIPQNFHKAVEQWLDVKIFS